MGTGLLSAACEKAKVPSESGADLRPYGERAAQDKSVRVVRELTASVGSGSSRTQLQDLYGTITPKSLHFEMHHSGVPTLDAGTHDLLVHGFVEHPLDYSMAALRRFPSVSQT